MELHSEGDNAAAKEALQRYAQGGSLWLSDPLGTCSTLVISDVDQDGSAEVIAGEAILNGATGALEVNLPESLAEFSVVDVNADGAPDIVAPSDVYDASGTLIAAGDFPATSVAVGQLDSVGRRRDGLQLPGLRRRKAHGFHGCDRRHLGMEHAGTRLLIRSVGLRRV